MIERQYGRISLICDTCGDCFGDGDYTSDEFRLLLDDAKADGWRTFKNDYGDWEHKCGGCMISQRHGHPSRYTDHPLIDDDDSGRRDDLSWITSMRKGDHGA